MVERSLAKEACLNVRVLHTRALAQQNLVERLLILKIKLQADKRPRLDTGLVDKTLSQYPLSKNQRRISEQVV